jgi:flagellar basal body P-ring protein FlgI
MQKYLDIIAQKIHSAALVSTHYERYELLTKLRDLNVTPNDADFTIIIDRKAGEIVEKILNNSGFKTSPFLPLDA